MRRAAALALLAGLTLAGCGDDEPDTWRYIAEHGDPALVRQATAYAVQQCGHIADGKAAGECIADQAARKYRELAR